MFAWISRYNGIKRDLGTLNNTCLCGTEKEIMHFAKTYGRQFCKVQIHFHNDESTKYGKADKTIILFPLDK